MALGSTLFPTSLDTATELPAPTSTTLEDDVGYTHDEVHKGANAAIAAVEAKVGADGSAVTTSFDFMLRRIPRVDKTSNYTIVAADKGKLLVAATTTAFTFTLPNSATADADWHILIKNEMTGSSAANKRNSIARAGTNTIDGSATTRESYPGELVLITNDGAGAFKTQILEGWSLELLNADSPFTITWPGGLWGEAIIDVWGGGGGGGAGRRGAAASVRAGGGGGGGAACFKARVARANLGATSTATIAATAAGGAAQTVDATNGVIGTAGNNSTFTVSGQTVTGYGGGAGGDAGIGANSGGGGGGALGAGGAGGAGVNSSGGSPSTAGSATLGHFGGGGDAQGTAGLAAGTGGGAGGGTSTTTTALAGGCSSEGGSGGGAGGCVTSGNAGQTGGAGGASTGVSAGGGAGGAGGATGTAGTAGTAGPRALGPGTGGGGGGGGSGGVGGTGGAGGIACGGGGGGGALNGNNSGAGGAGGAGLIRVRLVP